MRKGSRFLVGTGVVLLVLLPMVGSAMVSAPSRVSPVLGPPFRISGPSRQVRPDLAWNATAGEYLVVWEDRRDFAASDWEIYGRRVGADGSLLGADVSISGGADPSWEFGPAVACNQTDGSYLVVWSGGHARVVAADGTPQGTSSLGGAWQNPRVAWNSVDNEYLVVWPTYDGVFGQRLTAAGALAGGSQVISSSADVWAESAAVVWNATDEEYFVVWDSRWSDPGVFGRRVSAAGSPLGNDVVLTGPNPVSSSPFWADVAWSGAAGE